MNFLIPEKRTGDGKSFETDLLLFQLQSLCVVLIKIVDFDNATF